MLSDPVAEVSANYFVNSGCADTLDYYQATFPVPVNINTVRAQRGVCATACKSPLPGPVGCARGEAPCTNHARWLRSRVASGRPPDTPRPRRSRRRTLSTVTMATRGASRRVSYTQFGDIVSRQPEALPDTAAPLSSFALTLRTSLVRCSRGHSAAAQLQRDGPQPASYSDVGLRVTAQLCVPRGATTGAVAVWRTRPFNPLRRTRHARRRTPTPTRASMLAPTPRSQHVCDPAGADAEPGPHRAARPDATPADAALRRDQRVEAQCGRRQLPVSGCVVACGARIRWASLTV